MFFLITVHSLLYTKITQFAYILWVQCQIFIGPHKLYLQRRWCTYVAFHPADIVD